MARTKKPSLSEIAAAAGVSVSTVSLVLNRRGKELRIAKDTQEKIIKIAAELGYAPSAHKSDASIPVKKLFRIVVFFANAFQDFPLERFNQGMLRYCSLSQMNIDWVYHHFIPDHLNDYTHLFSKKYYDGIIVASPYDKDILFLKNNHFSIPVVLYNCQINDYTCVCRDEYEVGRQAAEVFFRHKHEKIAVITPLICNKSINLRVAGFINYFNNPSHSNIQIKISKGPKKDIAGGFSATQSLLEKGFIPTAIYIINDLMSGGVINYLIQKQLRIPEDVEILSFGDADAASMIPSISSYLPKSEEMAFQCVKCLISEVNGTSKPGSYYSFGTECIWRDSCRDY